MPQYVVARQAFFQCVGVCSAMFMIRLALLAMSFYAFSYAQATHPVTGRQYAGVMGPGGAPGLVRSERELAKFASLWQQHGSQTAEAIRTRFPLTHSGTPSLPSPGVPPLPVEGKSANEPQTGPGPDGSGDTSAPEAPAPDAPSNA